MSPEHVLFESRRSALAFTLADAVDCYNHLLPSAQRVAEAEVEAVYHAYTSGNSVCYVLSRLVQALEGLALSENQRFSQEIYQALKKACTVLEPNHIYQA